jgi:hypothetical protein
VPWLGSHAVFISFRPGLVKAEFFSVLTQPRVLYRISKAFQVVAGWRSVDVPEVDGGLAGNGVLRIPRRRCVTYRFGDIPSIDADEPVDEDNDLIRGRAIA